MLKKILLAFVMLLLLLSTVLLLALRDNPARPAVGERKVAAVGEAEIHYFVNGPASSQPVVLLPSYARSVSDFNELVAQLTQQGYRSLAMLPRGIDGSSLTSLDLRYADYAQDLAAVLSAEAVTKPVVIIGHAYGNRIARSFSQLFPQRVKGLILLAAGGNSATPAPVSAAIMKAMFGIFPASVQAEAVAFAFFARNSDLAEHWLHGWYPLAGLAQGNATANSVYQNWGDGGVAPMVILQPLEDAAAGDGAALLQQQFPQRVTVYPIADAGHALLPEQPEQVRQLILQSLQQWGEL